MGTPLAAIDVKIGYSLTKTGTYKRIPDLKTSGDFNPAPNTADATTFDNVEYTTYVDLLKDLGGAIEFGANLTSGFISAWEDCVTAAGATGCYFAISVDGVSKSVFFKGKPSALGMPSLTANALIETSVYITPIGEPEWGTDPSWETTSGSGD